MEPGQFSQVHQRQLKSLTRVLQTHQQQDKEYLSPVMHHDPDNEQICGRRHHDADEKPEHQITEITIGGEIEKMRQR